MRVKFGTMAFTSRMILGFAAASKDSSLTVKEVFSFGFSSYVTTVDDYHVNMTADIWYAPLLVRRQQQGQPPLRVRLLA